MKYGKTLISGLLVMLPLFSTTALAAEDEIQVYGNELNEDGELGLELHMNYVADGSAEKAWPQQQPSRHMFRLTPEISYGIGHNMDVGLYLPLIKGVGDDFRLDGLKFRFKYLEGIEGDGFYWGMNVEVGRVSLRTTENHWNVELRPILGWKQGKWEFTANPKLGWALSERQGGAPVFAPALKLAYSVQPDLAVGIEQYSELGPVNKFLPGDQQEHATFLAIDGKVGKNDYNVGLGRGWGANADKWVIKGILGFSF